MRSVARLFSFPAFRFGLGFASAIIIAAGVRGTAQASNCGMSAFETLSVPYLKKAEELPLTADTIFMHNGMNSEIAGMDGFGPPACADEPLVRNRVADLLYAFWHDALIYRADVAALKIVNAGGTTMLRACIPAEPALLRYRIADSYANDLPTVTDADGQHYRQDQLKALKASPYYAHIDALWTEIFHDAGVSRPRPSEVPIAWRNTYSKAAQHEREQIPRGCPEEPMQTALKVDPTPVPR